MRRVLKIIGILLLLVVVGATAFVFLVPTDRIVQIAADQVKAATGRDLAVSGGVSPSFYPVLGVEAEGITLSNADWARAEHMVEAGSVKIGVELMPLLSGTVKVTELRLIDPVIALEVAKDGRQNWVLGEAAVEGAAGGDPASQSDTQGGGGLPEGVSLDQAVIENGTVRLNDRQSGMKLTLTKINAETGLQAMDQPLAVKGSAVWQKQKVDLDLSVDNPAAALAGREAAITLALGTKGGELGFDGVLAMPQAAALPTVAGDVVVTAPDPAGLMAWATGTDPDPALAELSDLGISAKVALSEDALKLLGNAGITRDGREALASLNLEGGENWLSARSFDVTAEAKVDGLATFDYKGSASAPEGAAPALDGRVALDVPDLKALADFAGVALPEAQPGAFRTLSVNGRVTTPGPDRIRFAARSIKLDDIELKGNVNATMKKRLRLKAKLEAGALDLRPYVLSPEAGGGGSAQPSGGGIGWSKEPIDLTALNALNADVSILAASVRAPNLKLGKSDIRTTLKNGKLDLTITELGLYGGGVKGVVSVDGTAGNALKADVSASAIRLLPMLRELADLDMIQGRGAMKINVAGRGKSLHAIMNSLDGDGSVKLTNGALIGYNLGAMVRNIQSAFTDEGGSQKTDFSEVSGTFDIEKGVLTNADFKFLGPLIRITGQGTADLGGQLADFRLVPKAVATLEGQGGAADVAGLAFPLLISGPWHDLSIVPDLTGGIRDIIRNPGEALDAVRGLVDGANPDALRDAAGGALNAVTGGDGGAGVPAVNDAAGALDALTGDGEENGEQREGVGGAFRGLLRN